MKSSPKENLFWRLMRAEQNTVAGHEDFVTEAFASVLVTDPALGKHIFESLLDVSLGPPGKILFKTQSGYSSSRVGSSSIDLEVRTESCLIFVENKIEAKLNQYVIEAENKDEQELINQLQKYDIVLSEMGPEEPADRHLIAIGQVPLEKQSSVLKFYRRQVFWWDIYVLIQSYLSSSTGNSDHEIESWLAREFLRFMEFGKLSQPMSIRKDYFEPSDATRLLADAIQRAGGFADANRAQSGRGFSIKKDERSYVVWFTEIGELRVFEISSGALKPPPMDSDFWTASVDDQANCLTRIIKEIPGLDRDSSARVDLDSALNQFHENYELANYIVKKILERWPQNPETGKGVSKVKEIRMSVGSFRVAVAPYATFERLILIFGADRVPEVAGEIESMIPGMSLELHITSEQINIPLRSIGTLENADRVLNVISALSDKYEE
jgi:hypothetical protein